PPHDPGGAGAVLVRPDRADPRHRGHEGQAPPVDLRVREPSRRVIARPGATATGGRLLARLDQPRVALAASLAALLPPCPVVLAPPHPLEQPLAVDADLYREAAVRWSGGGPFYAARQLAGPYEITPGDILYPPVGLWLFVPFTFLPDALAMVLWWAIPLGVTA